MDQVVILVDKKDKFLGRTTWERAHFGQGKRHRGFVVLLFDREGNVYLQKRKHRVFDGLWDFTAISHPHHVGKKEESLGEAALRSLKNEMGIGKVELKSVGAFVYTARDGEWCENEYCHVLTGKFDGKFKPNEKFVYDAKKIPFESFVAEVKKSPKKFTPWVVKAVPIAGKAREIWEVRELEEDWGRFKGEFEKYYTTYFKTRIKDVKKYPRLIQKFYGELEDFGKGGKRLRPYLVWLGYRLAKSQSSKDLKKILPVCLAYELMHSFLLIHDDIIDRSDTRRGKPAIHKGYEKIGGPHYGLSQAILLGDLVFVEAFYLIAKANIESKLKVGILSRLVEITRETMYGEALDVEYGLSRPVIKQIWQVYDLKTASYSFVGPMSVGVILAGATYAMPSALMKFGMQIGRAYQLKDDVLGVFGDEKVLGKSVLSDMREGKNTVLIFKALEMSGQKERQSISRIWGKRDGGVKELGEIREVIAASGALEWCEGELLKLVGEADNQVKKITKDNTPSKILRQLAVYAVSREN